MSSKTELCNSNGDRNGDTWEEMSPSSSEGDNREFGLSQGKGKKRSKKSSVCFRYFLNCPLQIWAQSMRSIELTGRTEKQNRAIEREKRCAGLVRSPCYRSRTHQCLLFFIVPSPRVDYAWPKNEEASYGDLAYQDGLLGSRIWCWVGGVDFSRRVCSVAILVERREHC